MKNLSILILLVLISACSGTKKAIETAQPESTKEVVETPKTPEIPEVSEVRPETNVETAEVDDTKESMENTEVTESNKPAENMTTEKVKTIVFDHSKWNTLLQKNVSDNGAVNYKSFKNDRVELNAYIDDLMKNMPIESWSKEDKLVYWINAYNALTIDLILRNQPLNSIKDIKDPWDQRLWKFGDKWQNLNDIEHKILRKMNEPRIHFAIVCASASCPKLQNKAFTAEGLEAQLTNATKEFLSDTFRNEISQNNLKLSKIFKWFKKDFEQNGSLVDFLNQYSEVSISDKAKKSFKDYSWDLNN